MKDKKDLIGLSHSAFANQIKALKELPPAYNMHGLIEENKLKWFFKMLSQIGNNHYPYQTYSQPKINNGIFKMTPEQDKNVSIALLSDWASDTAESHNIARLCGVKDYSIHLGDTYYVGNEKEIAENFNSTKNAPWKYGTSGSFAMLGNHEMYSGGKSYFTELLPYMGILKGENTNTQEASFFCLENKYWRIIGLDTGYYSLKGWLGVKPNFNMRLHDKQIDWLKNIVKPDEDKRGIILLTHHQPLSAFEPVYSMIEQQLKDIFGPNKTILWFWGHEHRLAIYGANKLQCGNVFGRCIGIGGMPVELNSDQRNSTPIKVKESNLIIYDDRVRETIDGDIKLGHNGYAVLNLHEQELIIKYYDDNDNKKDDKRRKILEEKWSIDIESGTLKGEYIKDFTQEQDKKMKHFLDDIDAAIKQA